MDTNQDKVILSNAETKKIEADIRNGNVDPMNRDPKLLKVQVREFLYNIQKKLKTGGLDCRLTPNLQSQGGRSVTIISFKFSHETESAPMAFIETKLMFSDPEQAEGEIVKQIHDTLKTLARIAGRDNQEAKDSEPKELIV